MYEGRGAQRVDLRRTTATGPTGIYRCYISTEAVHRDGYISVRATVCCSTEGPHCGDWYSPDGSKHYYSGTSEQWTRWR